MKGSCFFDSQKGFEIKEIVIDAHTALIDQTSGGPIQSDPDIVVIGGGNAPLCSAITAAEVGAHVLILETAPKPYRGGNSRHTRNFRSMHTGSLGPLVDSYSEEEYFADLKKVPDGKTDEHLARLAIRTSEECLPWMQERGVRFQPSLSGTLSLARTNAFFLGGGKGLVNAYYRTAQALGVQVLYEAAVTHLEMDGDHMARVDFPHEGAAKSLTSKSVIVASDGFQAGTDWLARACVGTCGEERPDPWHALQSRRCLGGFSGSRRRTGR
ncbi:FAD-binding protein [Sulfitobacter sp.]|uniref:FAD-binding protein n=1 Tax=Sulfitobacter sp. TaxID=1903071 RepID=UPI003FCCF4E9